MQCYIHVGWRHLSKDVGIVLTSSANLALTYHRPGPDISSLSQPYFYTLRLDSSLTYSGLMPVLPWHPPVWCQPYLDILRLDASLTLTSSGLMPSLLWQPPAWCQPYLDLLRLDAGLTLTSCSMQMLTDWSRTRFLKVVFTSIIISSYVELCETVYLFVFRIRRIFKCSTIV